MRAGPVPNQPDSPDGATIRMSISDYPDLIEAIASQDDAERDVRGHILLVESDAARPAACALNDAGFTVSFVDDGAAAFVMLEGQGGGAGRGRGDEPFDAVLTDVSVSGIGGIDLLRFIRNEDRELPVVLMADARDVESAAAAVEHGAFQYLLKPLTPPRLIEAMEKAVRARREARSRREAFSAMDRTVDNKQAAPDRARWDEALRTLWMAYQPIFVPDGRLYAHEALVRSEEPTLLGAGPILDMADAVDGMRELGRAVRMRVGHHATRVAGQHFIFVNLHAHDLLDETLTAPDSPLARAASSIVLEITERAALHDVEEAKAKMAELRALGYRIALDDLGAGYAGLTSFAQIRPEIVKLDMALVRDIDKDALKRRLVASVIQVSRDIGTLVVGEGVETPAERDTLIELGCHLLQGFLLGKPARIA